MLIELFFLLLVIVLLILILFLLLPELLFHLANFVIKGLQDLTSLVLEELDDIRLHLVDIFNHFLVVLVHHFDVLGGVAVNENLILLLSLFLLLNELFLLLIIDICALSQILLVSFLLHDVERPSGFVTDFVLELLNNIFVLLFSLDVSMLLLI